MIDGYKGPDGKPASASNPGCLVSRPLPGLFLRLQSPREDIGLPYSCLLKLLLRNFIC